MRVEQFELWASRTRPPVIFWLSGFTFPTGFLTAVLQSSARQNNVSNVESVVGMVAGDMYLLSSLGVLPYSHIQSPDFSGQPLLGVYCFHCGRQQPSVSTQGGSQMCSGFRAEGVLVEKEGAWEQRWERRGGRTGVLATEGLDFPPPCPHVSPGWCLGSGPIPGGCWLGPEELLLGGGRAHAACLPHAHDPLPAYREPQEECQGWDSALKLAGSIPSLDPNPVSAPPLPHTCSCPALPEAPGSDSFSSPSPKACTPVPAITIPTGQATQTAHRLSLASTSALGP